MVQYGAICFRQVVFAVLSLKVLAVVAPKASLPWRFLPTGSARPVPVKLGNGSTFTWELRDKAEWPKTASPRGFTPQAARVDVDEEGGFETHTMESFAAELGKREELPTVCERHLVDFKGVPMFVIQAEGKLRDAIPQLREYFLKREVEVMNMSPNGATYGAFENSPAENSTTSRSQWQDTFGESRDEPLVKLLVSFVRKAVVDYFSCLGSTPAYFRDDPVLSKHMYPLKPIPLYAHSWFNAYHHSQQQANSLKWHSHQSAFHGYFSINTVTAATMFRSTANTSQRWKLEHKEGMLFIMPGGTLHTTTPWTHDKPRITVAFNVSPLDGQPFPGAGIKYFNLITPAMLNKLTQSKRHHTWPMLNVQEFQTQSWPYHKCHEADDGFSRCPWASNTYSDEL